MSERQKSLTLLASLASLIIIGLFVSAVLLLRSPPDESLWFVRQPGMSMAWTAKGRPIISGTTCTFVESNTGKTMVISGRFEVESVK